MAKKKNKSKINPSDSILVLIEGSVYDGKKYLVGEVLLPRQEAMNLVKSKHAIILDDGEEINTTTEIPEHETPTEE